MFDMFGYNLQPQFSPIDERPPTLYSIMNSIVNFRKEEKEKIKDLAKLSRTTIFDFKYPLSTKIKKEDFECMILNKFLMRRIGFETMTAFQIQLNVKLNEIMPNYNKLFDVLENWNIFEDGEKTIRDLKDNRITDTENTESNTLEKNATTNSNFKSERRNSDLPQSEIENLQDDSYMTNYNLNNDNTQVNDKSSEKVNSSAKSNVIDNGSQNEIITRTQADKIKQYNDFIQNRNNIYTMIFKDLDCLFYQLV